VDIGSSGLVVGGGVFAFLIATFGVALKLLLMAEQKDDVNYGRLLEQLHSCEQERAAGRDRARETEARVRAECKEEIDLLKGEVELWRGRALDAKGDGP
jgi:hypothetical protein